MEGAQIMSFSRKELIKQIIKETNPTSAKDVQETLKDLFADTLKEMLEAELDDHLGYSKYDYKNKNTSNSRNGRSSKKVISDLGEFQLDVPRDRNGSFEPEVVKKNQSDISGIEDQVIGMYAKGMTTRDIATHLENIYGFEASPTLISGITDKITPIAKEWQNRPLEAVYPIIFMDAIHYKVKQDNRIINKAAYAVIGINLDGIKEVLGIWIGANETSKYWLLVLNELKNRGVNDILIACVDGLNGFKEAIKAIYPRTEIQRCIIHQIRNSSKYVSYKDLKAFNGDLKLI
ncbi:MAG: transposase [Clostridium sp.]|nr:transposase [Clostridium sp.]